jgi:hypothetical protein
VINEKRLQLGRTFIKGALPSSLRVLSIRSIFDDDDEEFSKSGIKPRREKKYESR